MSQENNPYNIAKDIVNELKNNHKNIEDGIEILNEYIEPYITYYSDCHEILKNYHGDTSYFENFGKKAYDDIAVAYAYQCIESEINEILNQ